MPQRREPKVWMQPLLLLVACESLLLGVGALLRPAFLTGEVALCMVVANLAGLLSWRSRRDAPIPLKNGEKFLIALVILVFLGHRLMNSPIAEGLVTRAALRNDVETLRLLLILSAPRERMALKKVTLTPLTAAFHAHNLGPAKLLLESGADPNRADFHGWTPLMIARYRGDDVMATLLMQYGATEQPLPVLPKKKP